jgi:hypothetical protein
MVFGMCTRVAPRRRSLAPNLREPLDAGADGLQVASVGISSAIAPVIDAVGYLLPHLPRDRTPCSPSPHAFEITSFRAKT